MLATLAALFQGKIEYALLKEISEFAEFKIRKMCEGVIQNAVDSRKAD